jgi:tetratricopeptide (TPR) repeat protein
VRARTITLAVLLSLGAAAEPSVARAQDAQPAGPDVERARELFREGVALMAAENYAGALVKFKEVGRSRMTAQVAFNIAECEEKLGKLVAALGNYRLALAKAQEPGANAPAVATNAPDRIAALEKRIAKLTVVRKEEKPNPTAKIELDGVELAPAQLGSAIPTDPGERTLRVVSGERALVTRVVKVAEGESLTVTLNVPAPVEQGPVGPGPEPTSSVSIPGVVLTVLGGGMLVAGGVFLGLRQGAISDLDEQCGGDRSCPASAEETYDQGRLYTGLAEGFVPTGVAAATVGVVLLVLQANAAAESRAETGRVELAPALGADAGLGMRVRF